VAEPASRHMLLLPTSRWRALFLMAEAEKRTPQQQLAYLFERWWTGDPECKAWQEEAYKVFPEMRKPFWWRQKEAEDNG